MIRIETLRSRSWPIVCTVLLLFFAGTRLYDLRSRPLHHDEGVNGMFLKNLVQNDNWKYDPENYHGPTLYYFQLIPTWVASYFADGAASFDRKSISGITTVMLRVVIAVAGVLMLFMLLQSWPLLGKLGAATACILAGMSCDMIFLSRYFIHETYVLIFTFGTLLAGFRYRSTRDPVYAYLCGLSATLLFCTKETALFHLVILLLAYLCTELTIWYVGGRREPLDRRALVRAPMGVIRELGRAHAINIAVMCLVIWVALYSSFFTNWKGPLDSLRTYFFWTAEGMESGHEKPTFYYLTSLIIRYETVALFFGLVGIVVAFVLNERRGLFLAYWTLGMCAFYSIIPYKTPWLIVNLVLPLCVVGGYGAQRVFDLIRQRVPPANARVALAAMAGLWLIVTVAEARQTFTVNYKEYDKDKHPQVYAHTIREVNDMMAKIDAAASRAGKNMVINVFSETYWPLPLYLIRYPNVRFWGSKAAEARNPDAPVMIIQPKYQAELDAKLKDIYSIKTYNLRPGVPLALYVNTNLSTTQNVFTRTLDLLQSSQAPANLKAGLFMQAFRGVGFSGRPIQEVSGDSSYTFDWQGSADKKYEAPFSLKWTGYIRIEKAGFYKFALESDDGSWLTIDDTPVIDNGGDHPVIKLSRGVNLSEGYHKIELKYFDVLGGAVLRFTWAPPGSNELPVPGTVLYHRP